MAGLVSSLLFHIPQGELPRSATTGKLYAMLVSTSRTIRNLYIINSVCSYLR